MRGGGDRQGRRVKHTCCQGPSAISLATTSAPTPGPWAQSLRCVAAASSVRRTQIENQTGVTSAEHACLITSLYSVPEATPRLAGDKRLYRTLDLVNLTIWVMAASTGAKKGAQGTRHRLMGL